ncbi:hypothetical protein [Streptomyces sioyaensis]
MVHSPVLLITGVFDRIGVNNTNIGTTLQRLKHHLESPPAQRGGQLAAQ